MTSNSQALSFLQEHVPLAPRTTLGVGGPARFFAEGLDAGRIAKVIRHGRERGLPTFVLGGGSNLVVSDEGFEGLVATVDEFGIDITEDHRSHRVRVGAGVVWDELVAFTVDERLAGLECLSGIPGRVGAAPIQNIGAYGAEAADSIIAVAAIDLSTGERRTFDRDACGFGYRTSIFKGAARDRYLITSVDFRLARNAPAKLNYEELRKAFGGRDSVSDLMEVRDTVLRIRAGKSMVYDTEDPNHRSAGSFFVNPIVSSELADGVEAAARAGGFEGSMPRFAAGAGQVKLSAAWLIERSGFERGFAFGQARLSPKHALAIVNTGSARASDIVALAGFVRRGVQRAFGVTLEPEPIFLGFSKAVDELLS